MKTCNWMVTDLSNKRKDLISKARDVSKSIEEKILAINSIKLMDRSEVLKEWKLLEDRYKTNSKNLGCA